MRFIPPSGGWLWLLLLAFSGALETLHAQAPLPCLLLPLSPAERVAAAPLIVEAQVLPGAQGQWDAGHRRIYTRQQLRVFRVLKGSLPDTAALPLLLEGGQVGLVRQELTNTQRPLPAGQQGIFFLQPAPWPGLAPGYTPYASSQGIIAFDLATNSAAEPARTYPSPAAALAQTSQLSAQPAQELRPNYALAAAARRVAAAAPGPAAQPQLTPLAAPAISGFSPAVATAGTGTVLTLVGSGFGSSAGSGGIDFRNADDGGATTTRALAFDVLSWSDTRIQVRVPSLATGGHPAGTGLVRVTTADGSTADTAAPLVILYAVTTINDQANTFVDRPNHVATNAEGGLSFQLSPNFRVNAAAVAAWQRGLAQWRCSTGINWRQGADATANTIAMDQANVIAFDDANNLPARVLGRTTSYYQGGYNAQGQVVFYVSEIDQQFTASLPFQFGPALAGPGQYDFESVAVHELGHAQQLNHLIRLGAIMHYAIAAAANLRTLNPASDVAGGRLVLRTRSFRNRGVGGAPLLPAPLTSLAAEAGSAAFSFTTRDECFASGFVLERSAGLDTAAAVAGWQAVASTGAGLAGGQYRLLDPQPTAGLRYYRLGVRRPDGSTDYAAPLPAAASSLAAAPQVFPNPVAGDQLQLLYTAAAAGRLVLRFYDEAGRYHLGRTATVLAGANLLSVSAAGLQPGFYLVRLSAANQPDATVRLVRL